MNGTAEEEPSYHEALLASGGRQRARGRTDTQKLQAAIAWVAGLKLPAAVRSVGRPGQGRRAADHPRRPGRGDREICFIIADSGLVLVSFKDEQTTEQRLAAAAVLYHITPAQMRLAGLIIGGDSLVQAARRLGVSINTARTQLRRMFREDWRQQPDDAGHRPAQRRVAAGLIHVFSRTSPDRMTRAAGVFR